MVSSMAGALAVVLRTAFMVLGCVIAAAVIYTVATDGLPFRKELLTPYVFVVFSTLVSVVKLVIFYKIIFRLVMVLYFGLGSG